MDLEMTQQLTIERAAGGGFAVYADGTLFQVAEKGEDVLLHVANIFRLPAASYVNTDVGVDETAKILLDLIASTRISDRGGNRITISMIKAIRALTRSDLKAAKDAFERDGRK